VRLAKENWHLVSKHTNLSPYSVASHNSCEIHINHSFLVIIMHQAMKVHGDFVDFEAIAFNKGGRILATFKVIQS
jgi:hypothetical protein